MLMTKLLSAALLSLTSFLAGTGCVTPETALRQGIQKTYESFVPARIAVLSCTLWPNSLRFPNQPLSNVSDQDVAKICEAIDTFVIDGFKDQPFMRGYSPKAVSKLLSNSNRSEMLDSIPQLWSVPIEACENCSNAPTMYHERLSPRADWRLWLNDFSRSTRFSDALLIPFVTYAYKVTEDERGLTVAKTAMGAQLLLIDTNTARLIWAGGRSALSTEQARPGAPDAEEIVPPDLERVLGQLLVDDIWREFPGRQF